MAVTFIHRYLAVCRDGQQERTDDHDYKWRVVHEVPYHHHSTGSQRGDGIKISSEVVPQKSTA